MRILKRKAEPEIYHAKFEAADVAAFGAVLTGAIKIADLAKGTRIDSAILKVNVVGAGPTVFTASLGVTGAAYEDVLADTSVKAVAITEAAGATVGTILAADSSLYIMFVGTVANLSTATGLDCEVHVETTRIYN